MPRRRPEFDSGVAGAEAAKLIKFSDAGRAQILWLPDEGKNRFFGSIRYNFLTIFLSIEDSLGEYWGVSMFFLAAHPILESYTQSDWMGKGIYLGLFLLSIISWAILIQKILLVRDASIKCRQFRKQKINPLKFEGGDHPMASIFETLKKQTLELLNKNFQFAKSGSPAYLSPSDIDFIEAHVATSIAGKVQDLEKNVYILSTIVTLAPFLGLLGTVWGILVTFSGLQNAGGGNTNQMVLAGLSLALTTTVLGLLVAIPALIGYNYIKNRIKELYVEMETYSEEALASVELQYRKPDIS